MPKKFRQPVPISTTSRNTKARRDRKACPQEHRPLHFKTKKQYDSALDAQFSPPRFMKILLAEDDAMIGENIQIALNGEGVTVDWVKDGIAAEAALAVHTYDALLLDLGLPEKDGIEVLRGLRSRSNHTPVLILTARDTVSQRVLGLKSGADDYLVKPFDLEELMARLEALVRRARGGESVYRRGQVEIHALTRQALVSGRQV